MTGDTTPFGPYALVAVVFWFVAVPAGLLILRVIGVCVGRAIQRHIDRQRVTL